MTAKYRRINGRLKRFARKKGLRGKSYNAYVYGTASKRFKAKRSSRAKRRR